ncbi:MAG: exodeoxyribonuclease VII large subunit, partial [marine benthic group bacterium]|nr:exodeoxyribonuclease VII large subunit [Gemmatimonadota bacterium]
MPSAEAVPVPGASPETAVPVAEVNAAVARLLEESFTPLWVRGEISNWKPHRSGHRWFSLRDEDHQISCVMWKSDVARLPAEPQDGMAVAAFGSLGLWEKRGDFRLVVRRLEAEGEGLWRLAFERIQRKLAEEGLLDPSRKLSIPRVPRTVGIVTSRSGAALRDVVTVIRRRAPWTRILVSDCRVQGDGAPEEIRSALARLLEEGSSDVILLTRGGGSIEDLWAFNDESLARAIAASPIPIVTGVGHEIDVTIADLVADLRAPTPSAAAEAVTEERSVIRSELQSREARLIDGLRSRISRDAERTRQAGRALEDAWRRTADSRRSRLAILAGRLRGLSPLGAMERGFAVPLDAAGSIMRSATDFRPGLRFELRLLDGA